MKTGHVYLNIYSDQADGEIGIIASMFKEMADAFSQIEGTGWVLTEERDLVTVRRVLCSKWLQMKIFLRYKCSDWSTCWLLERATKAVVWVSSNSCSCCCVAVDQYCYITMDITLQERSFFRTRSHIRLFLELRRRYICVLNRPLRERQRINWLRMSIKMTRGKGYLKRFKVYAQLTSKNGIIGMIARIVTGKTHYRCLQCLVAGGANSENFMPCLTPSCGAFYCFDCLPYLKNQCRKCSWKVFLRFYTIKQNVNGLALGKSLI